MNLNELAQEVKEINESKGFAGNREIGMLLALVHSELSEALEDWRKGHEVTEVYYTTGTNGQPKPCGIPTELADVIIRVLDICAVWGIDIDSVIRKKLEYNKSRPYRHGGMRS